MEVKIDSGPLPQVRERKIINPRAAVIVKLLIDLWPIIPRQCCGLIGLIRLFSTLAAEIVGVCILPACSFCLPVAASLL